MNWRKWHTMLVVGGLSGCAVVVYALQIEGTEVFIAFDWSPAWLAGFLLSIGAVVAWFPARVRRPSDLFLVFYLLLSAVWGNTLWWVQGTLDWVGALVLMVLTLLPVVVIYFARNARISFVPARIERFQLISSRWLMPALVALLAISATYSYLVVGGGSFDWNSMYERRLYAREAFGVRGLGGYLSAMAMNTIGPLLALIGAYRARYLPVLIALALAAFWFWLIGAKAPTFYVFALAYIGWSARRGSLERLGSRFALILLGVFALAVLEALVTGFSLIGDLIVRRMAVVAAQVQIDYVDFILNRNDLGKVLLGIHIPDDSSIAFVIGEEYFGRAETSANANAFLYAVGQNGLVGYVIAVVGVATFFLVLDTLYRRTGHVEYMALAAIYSVVIAEQAFTTALVTSGVGLAFLLVFLMSGRDQVPMRVCEFGEGTA